MSSWINQSVIYHIYTLGFCGAPEQNSDLISCENKIQKLAEWIEHLKNIGVNTILFGPLFESTSHGYDTTDYYKVDRRIGCNEDFKAICQKLHDEGFRIVLDGVFNHVGRDFFAFKDLQQHKEASHYKDWFINVNFGGDSPYHDGFYYEGWEGHFNLVKLNVWNQDVRDYLFGAVKLWVDEFDIDGLRLDVAYCIDEGFLRALRTYVDALKLDFWLMGEMIHGDYRRLMQQGMLDSVTNYECYKGIYSSHNDKNYFEINYSLNRLFGKGGLYENCMLYNFVDNHDVERIATILGEKKNLENVYTLLLTMPGVPAIYYGSEWGIEGKKEKGSDRSLRPELDIKEMTARDQLVAEHIGKVARIRQRYEALREGAFEQVVVRNQQLIFARVKGNERVYIALNLDEKEAALEFKGTEGCKLIDVLGEEEEILCENGQYRVQLLPFSGKICVVSQPQLE